MPSVVLPLYVTAVLDALDDYLAYRTYFADPNFGYGDATIWGTIRGNNFAIGTIKKPGRPHLQRWFTHVETLDVPQQALRTFSQSVDVVLPNVVKGKVVVRFAPEPSGYLHIAPGQIHPSFRRDDTNPLKEEGEFEEAIQEDLKMIDISFDKTVHTSDHFDEIREFTIPSKNRDLSIEENLKRFADMCEGTEEGKKWSLRAKIDYQHKNGTLRDPVIYRYVDADHHVVGKKYRAYPMYDLACPVIDHLDGVTHALLPQNPQHRDLRLLPVNTVLSKRKLKYLVEKGVVNGWDVIRFPTVRGIRSRGMSVQGLKNYILPQGASQQAVQLEWDGTWTTNKKVIDPITPRYWAIAQDKNVTATIKGREIDAVDVVKKPLRKKNPEVGEKEMITAMDWGNAFVAKKNPTASGDVASLQLDLHLTGDFKKTSKKVTWLAAPTAERPLIPVALMEYDYLITKKKLEEDDDLNEIINPKTEYRTLALASREVANLKKWDIIQFERKGFYICQGTKDAKGRMEFGFIPDGRAATVAQATPAVEKPKVAGAAKGSWGKPGPKAKAEEAVAAAK
ncbi:hypothetical protein IAR50_007527 [Cryptococcus sp. DSM 104548]